MRAPAGVPPPKARRAYPGADRPLNPRLGQRYEGVRPSIPRRCLPPEPLEPADGFGPAAVASRQLGPAQVAVRQFWAAGTVRDRLQPAAGRRDSGPMSRAVRPGGDRSQSSMSGQPGMATRSGMASQPGMARPSFQPASPRRASSPRQPERQDWADRGDRNERADRDDRGDYTERIDRIAGTGSTGAHRAMSGAALKLGAAQELATGVRAVPTRP